MSDLAPIVTIDGPSASGKGTVAAALAQRLGWRLLDSGALYRLVALAARQDDIALDDEAALSRTAANLDVKFVAQTDAAPIIYLNEQAVGKQLRSETTGNIASKVAALPAVRQALLQRQRDFHQPPGLVADGRDMGTVVFPEADVKFFLFASARVRAERRYQQLKEKGIKAKMGGLLREIEARDARDANRVVAPLKPALDAHVIDTSAIDAQEVGRRVWNIFVAHIPPALIAAE